MCGRFYLDVEFEDLLTRYDLRYFEIDYEKSQEIYPTNNVLTIVNKDEELTGHLMRWGFVTSFSKKPLINARSEGVFDKRTFAKPIGSRRCLVPASGYYEWRKEENQKIKTKIYIPEKKIISLAACYQLYMDADGNKVPMVTILTKEAQNSIKHIHDRMPVILDEVQEMKYMDKKTSRVEIEGIIGHSQEFEFELQEIG